MKKSNKLNPKPVNKIELENDNKSLIGVVENLRNGKPSIWLRCNSNMDGVLDDSKLAVSPFGLQDGEEEIVGARLAEELKNLN